MTSMRRKVAVFVNILLVVFAIRAQRDFELIESANFWLRSDNSAALTTFSVPDISHGNLYYQYCTGNLRGLYDGKESSSFGAGVNTYLHLGKKVVMAGNIGYSNTLDTRLAGSMLLPESRLRPFDLIETTEGTSGNKRMERFDISGRVGWNCLKSLSVGVSLDFTSGTYAKYKDLRHTNTLMNLNVGADLWWSAGGESGAGGGFVYDRRTETIKFDTYGTTDRIYTTLVEYANGYGILETFAGDGFTDATNELPLLTERIGMTAGGGGAGIYIETTYLHQTGSYGKRSQYTAQYADYEGDLNRWHLRYVLPKTRGYLCMFDLHYEGEILSSYRTNYRKITHPDNASVSFYEYYDPSKISDKARNSGGVGFSGHWKPAGTAAEIKNNELFLWNLEIEGSYTWEKHTAYDYPYAFTERHDNWGIHASGTRNIIFKNSGLLAVQLNAGLTNGEMSFMAIGGGVGYELPLRIKNVRPRADIVYVYKNGRAEGQPRSARNEITVSLGVTF